MGEIPRQEPDTLKSEHLAEGIGPIVACAGTAEEFAEDLAPMLDAMKTGHDINFFADPYKLEKCGVKNAGELTYVISPIDEKPKFTENLCDCTSLIAVGKNKSGVEVSLLTHQNPARFLTNKRKKFIEDLKSSLSNLKDMCAEGTIDVVLVGGRNYSRYEESINLLNSVVHDTFGFSPVVVTGPNEWGHDDGYFDTANRRLYVVRPTDKPITPTLHKDPFRADKVREMRQRWDKENKK